MREHVLPCPVELDLGEKAKLYNLLQVFRVEALSLHRDKSLYGEGNMVITYSRVWINRVRLQILLVVIGTEKLDSRDGFRRPVPRPKAVSIFLKKVRLALAQHIALPN